MGGKLRQKWGEVWGEKNEKDPIVFRHKYLGTRLEALQQFTSLIIIQKKKNYLAKIC